MGTMTDYTIYCTEEQARKALELGAPINTRWNYTGHHPKPFNKEFPIEFNHFAEVPTVEQMIGWLRKEKGLFVEPYLNGECCYSFSPIVSTKEDGEIIHLEAEDDPDKATLAAIDAALEYLVTNQRYGQ